MQVDTQQVREAHMSIETKQALEAAMHAHINDEEEDAHIITGWVLGAATSAFSGEDVSDHSYWFERAECQAPHIDRGLIDMLKVWVNSADDD